MELDDFKMEINKKKMNSLPIDPDRKTGLDDLISELKATDQRNRKQVAQFSIIIIILVMIYAAVMTRKEGAIVTGYELLIGGFFLVLIYFFFKINALRKIDYTEPVVTFLTKAESRYTFIKPAEWLVIGPLLVILGTGGGFIVYHSFSKYFDNLTITMVIYCIFFIGVILFGLWAGKKDWDKGNGKVLAKIRQMKSEIGTNPR